MNELAIQAEIGRRLREAIGRVHPNHALKLNGCACNGKGHSEIKTIVEALINGRSPFTEGDRNALYKLSSDALTALNEKFGGSEDEEELVDPMMPDHDVLAANMARAHRPKGTRSFEVEAHMRRAAINNRLAEPLPEFDEDDEAAAAMVQPSLDALYANRRKERQGY